MVEKKAPNVVGSRYNAVGPWIAPAILALCTIVFYWPVLSGAGVIWNDFIEQYFPYRVFAATSLRSGEFPFWNPYVFGGMPFFADLQTAVVYPLNILLTIFASKDWLSPLIVQYQIVLHVFGAGLFMYWFARELGCGRAAGLVAGLIYMFGGFTTTHIFHVTMVHALAWFPLCALLLRRMLVRSSLFYAALCAAVLAIIALAGHPQLMLYLYYWLGAYFVFHCITLLRNRRGWGSVVRPGALFALTVILGAGAAAVQLIPAGELGAASERPEMEFTRSCEGSFRPYRLVTILAPNYFGTPNNHYRKSESYYWGITSRDIDAGGHYYWETAAYAGVAALILAALALTAGRSAGAVFFGVMALISMLLAMGDSFFLYGLCYRILPGFSRFRLPGRFTCFFLLSIAPLAGLGMQWLISQARDSVAQTRKAVRIGVGVFAGLVAAWALLMSSGAFQNSIVQFILNSGFFGTDQQAIQTAVERVIYPQAVGVSWIAVLFVGVTAVIVILSLRGAIPARAVSTALALVVFADLTVFGAGYASVRMPLSRVYPQTPLVRELQQQGRQELFRVNMRDSKPGTDDAGGRNMVFYKNQGSVHRLFLTEGYNPLRLRRKFLNRKDVTLDILNVKFKINVDPSSGRIDQRFPLRQHATAMPRAWLAYRWEIAADTSDEAVLERLYAPDFDHRTTVLLEQEPAIESAQALDSVVPGTARVTKYGHNRIRIDTDSPRPALLVLSEIFFPAWRARVGDVETPVYRADFALRAIPVPAGKHTVECYYRSNAFARGRLLTLIALAFMVAAGVLGWRRERLGAESGNMSAARAKSQS